MIPVNTTTTLSQTVSQRLAAFASPEAHRLVTFGQELGWPVNVLGQAALPTEPVRVGKWLLIPVQQDTSQIPARTLERVQALYAAGLRPKGFVMVHEAPLELPAPTANDPRSAHWPTLSPEIKATLSALGNALGELAPVVTGLAQGALAVGAALSAVVFLGMPLVALLGAALLDPILVAVTEDGYWIEIDRWWS